MHSLHSCFWTITLPKQQLHWIHQHDAISMLFGGAEAETFLSPAENVRSVGCFPQQHQSYKSPILGHICPELGDSEREGGVYTHGSPGSLVSLPLVYSISGKSWVTDWRMMKHSSSSLHHPVSPHPRVNAAQGENGTRSPMRVKLLLRTVHICLPASLRGRSPKVKGCRPQPAQRPPHVLGVTEVQLWGMIQSLLPSQCLMVNNPSLFLPAAKQLNSEGSLSKKSKW